MNKAKEIIHQIKIINAELDRQTDAKMKRLQQLTLSFESHDTNFTQFLIEKQSVLQKTVQKKRVSNTDNRVKSEKEKKQVKRA